MKANLFRLLAALVLAASVSTAAPEPIPVDAEKPLQVVVHDNVSPRMRDGWTRSGTELERYRQFEAAMEEALKAAGYGGPVKVYQLAGNLPKTEQRLNIYIYRWQTALESFGPAFAAEFTMEAVLQIGDREYDLGTFSARESHVALGGPEAEDFRPVARRAIDQMIEFYRNAIAEARPTS